MKVLVTGGAGFIASNIVDAYILDGHEVIVVDNLSTGNLRNLNPKAKFYEMDICNPAIEEVFSVERPDVLNHHAAQVDIRKSVLDPFFDMKNNVTGLLNLMEAGRKNGLKRVILASSGKNIYGEQKTFPATEDHPANPISPYGVSKLTAERYLHYYYVQYGIPYISFRYADVYGPRQSPDTTDSAVAAFISKLLKGEQPIINGDGKQTRDYVFVGDVVELNRRAVDSSSYGCFNVGTGIETDLNTLFYHIKQAVKSKIDEKHGPSISGEVQRSCITSNLTQWAFGHSPNCKLDTGLVLTLKWYKDRLENRAQC